METKDVMKRLRGCGGNPLGTVVSCHAWVMDRGSMIINL